MSHLLLAAVAGSALLALGAAGHAQAREGDVLVQGRCTGGSTAKLKLSPENGRIEVELEVDQNRNGVRWDVQLRRGGRLVAAGVATTRPPSGSFEFRRLVVNRPGADVIRASARRASGEVCTASATWRR